MSRRGQVLALAIVFALASALMWRSAFLYTTQTHHQEPAKPRCDPAALRPPFKKASTPDQLPCGWVKVLIKHTAHTGEALNSLTPRSNDNGNQKTRRS